MKRFFIVLLLLILLAGLATPFVIKSFKDYSSADESTGDVTEAPSDETTSEIQTSESTTAETTTEEPTTFEPTPSIPVGNSGTILGTSAKGYDIIEVNGLTYVNGILVVNKTYSVPEKYNPGALTSECKSAFRKMQSAAEELGLTLTVCSGFRSYDTQKNLYNKYSEKDGKALADTYSARPGHSEHQTGLAIDVNSVKQSFANTPEGKWLKENCHKYGFILRYPEDKQSVTGYSYEPWHIRYVGKEAAKAIYESGLCLEEYLGITSAYNSDYKEETTKPAVPETTTKAPVQETTTKPVAPETTTVVVPETTTAAPETTTVVQETTTAAPETTTEAVQETVTVAQETAPTVASQETATDTPTEGN